MKNMNTGQFNSRERKCNQYTEDLDLKPIEERVSGIDNGVIKKQLEEFQGTMEEIALANEVIRLLNAKGGFKENRLYELLSSMENPDGEIKHSLVSSPKDTGRIGKMALILFSQRHELN